MRFDTWPMLVMLFACSAVLGLLCTLCVEWIARRVGWISKPSGVFRDHHKAVAMGGGLAVLLAVMLALPLAAPVSAALGAVIALAVACGLLGVADDLRPLGPGMKLVIECCLSFGFVLAVTPAASASDIAILLLGSLWIVSITNAFNLIDVSDGLLSGACLVAFLGWAFIDSSVAGLCVIFSGACAGFLVRNAPPAKVFLGDAGSLSLGAFAGGVTWLWMSQRGSLGLVSAALVFAIPLLEMMFLIAVRLAKRRAPWRASRDHLAIRLRAAGWSRPAIVCAAVICGAATSAAALLIQAGVAWYAVLAVIGPACIVLGAAVIRLAPAPASVTAVIEREG